MRPPEDKRREQFEIDYSGQAAVDPLAAFALEPSAGTPERAREPQRLVIPRRQNAGLRPASRAVGLVALAVVAWVALTVLKSPEDAVATGPKAAVQVEHRSVVAAPVLQQHNTLKAAGITGTRQSTPQRADESTRVLRPARPLRVQTAAPRNTASAVALPLMPQPRIINAPARPVTRAEEDSPRAVVSVPVATAGRDAALSASLSLPVPTAGVTPPESAVAPRVEPPRPAPLAAASAIPPAVSRGAEQRAAVEAVLGQYASAFSNLDARRAKAVWPSVNQKNLARAFDSLETQEFDLGACDITVLPPRALALCDGTAHYTPRVGNRKERTESRRWTFNLRQTGQEWAIESVDLR